MTGGYALHPEAFTDLDEIRDYIAQENPDAADQVIADIFDVLRSLVLFLSGIQASGPHIETFAVCRGTQLRCRLCPG